MRSTALIAAAALLAAMAFAPEARAGSIKSFKGPLVMNEQIGVSVENAGIRVLSYRFNRSPRGTANVFKIGGGPTIQFNVRNEGDVARDFALAVALYDKAGSLLGVGTEGNTGKIDPGEEKEVKVVFRDVNQNVATASALQLSLEIRL